MNNTLTIVDFGSSLEQLNKNDEVDYVKISFCEDSGIVIERHPSGEIWVQLATGNHDVSIKGVDFKRVIELIASHPEYNHS